MSRFIISDYSDENDEIDDDEADFDGDESKDANEIPNDIILTKDFYFPIKEYGTSENQNKSSTKKNLNNEMTKLLDAVLMNIENNEIKKSHDDFLKLQDFYKQNKKLFKKQIPNYFIRKLSDINQKITEQSKSNKAARLFQKDLKKYNKNFERELFEYDKNPEHFQEEVENTTSKDDDKYTDNNWFDENLEDANDNNENNLQAKSNHVYNDETIELKLRRYINGRSNGEIKTTVKRLNELYQKVTNPQLGSELLLEMFYTVENQLEKTQISNEDWEIILDAFSKLPNHSKALVPIYEKFNQHFLTFYSYYEIHNFYDILIKFINVMNTHKQKLGKQKEFGLYARLEIIFISHVFYRYTFDLRSHASYMLNILGKNIFDKSTTNDYKNLVSLYFAFNMILRKEDPQELIEMIKNIQFDSPLFDNDTHRILLNRTLTLIGIDAFKKFKYELSSKIFSKLINMKEIEEKIDKSAYPQLHSFDHNSVIVRYFFSVILYNLPLISFGINDQSAVSDKNKIIDDRVTEFFDKLTSEEKLLLQEKYQIIYNMVNYVKLGDWKNANTFVISKLGSIAIDKDGFLATLKKIFLCSFLMSHKSTTINTNTLETKFKMERKSILEMIENMTNGIDPIEKMAIQFNGHLSPDNKSIEID